MVRIIITWYRAKTYCPVIDSLRNEPEMWVTAAGYRAHKAKSYKPRYSGDMGPYRWVDVDSLFHKELDIEITDYARPNRRQVKRNGHLLPVRKASLHNAFLDRELAAARKVKADARAELNRVTQDAQTLRLARIVELRKALAVAEAADFAHRLENK